MNPETRNYDLSERIAKLERENRRMKRSALALLLLPVAFLVMAQAQAPKPNPNLTPAPAQSPTANPAATPAPATPPVPNPAQAAAPAKPPLPAAAPASRVVVASEFVLKDASGHMRARLWFGPKPGKSPSTALLTFYDSNGDRDLASLSVDGTAHSANLNLGGVTTGTASMSLSTDAKGSHAAFQSAGKQQNIQVSAESETSRIFLSAPGDPSKAVVNLTSGADGGELQVNDAQASGVVALSTRNKPGVSVKDRDGRSALLASDHLSFGDPQNNFPVVLYAGKDGPFFNLQDAQGFNVQMGVSRTITNTTGKRLTSTAAALRMFSDKGDLLWSAP
jgi:hypothetical protein